MNEHAWLGEHLLRGVEPDEDPSAVEADHFAVVEKLGRAASVRAPEPDAIADGKRFVLRIVSRGRGNVVHGGYAVPLSAVADFPSKAPCSAAPYPYPGRFS